MKQAQLNAALDLGKHETQVVPEEREPEEKLALLGFAARMQAENRSPAMVP